MSERGGRVVWLAEAVAGRAKLSWEARERMKDNREIQKTALGATESVNWKHFENPLDGIADLKMRGFKIISIEQVENPVFLNDFIPSKNEKYAIVMGNEVEGVSEEIIKESDLCIEVPQFGTKHSLNVSVCAGILVWDFFVKLKM